MDVDWTWGQYPPPPPIHIKVCAYGGEIGSTDTRRQWRIKKVNANDNFAPEMRLAA